MISALDFEAGRRDDMSGGIGLCPFGPRSAEKFGSDWSRTGLSADMVEPKQLTLSCRRLCIAGVETMLWGE
jgi:hypothetical protein